MALSNIEIIFLFVFVVVGSYITLRLYRWIVGRRVRRKEERSVTRIGRLYASGSEKIVRKGK